MNLIICSVNARRETYFQRSATPRFFVLALALASAMACSTGGAKTPPPVDASFVDPRSALCTAADAGPPTFALVQRIFTDNCVSCHTTGADLDLSSGHAWSDLVGHAAPPSEACGGTLVVAGDPDHSYLIEKLASDAPCSGERMPRTDFGSNPLPDCLVATLRAWVAAGALD
jgi:hypothetical protein